jgi:hypothetical protein
MPGRGGSGLPTSLRLGEGLGVNALETKSKSAPALAGADIS